MKRWLILWLGVCLSVAPVWAQTVATSPALSGDIARWLVRMQDASRSRAFVGTLVVNAGPVMSSSRIWHVCNGKQQIERVEALTGERRSTFRHDNTVVTFLPESRTVVRETRDSLGLMTQLAQRADASLAQFYQLRPVGHERVAGLMTDVVQLVPRDAWRFGYRIWTERQSGLIVKLQTLDADNRLLEQVAFSELEFKAPLPFEQLKQLMHSTQGYQVQTQQLRATTAQEHGWRLSAPELGFVPVKCVHSPQAAASHGALSLQCIFSDGLASLSVFMQPYDPHHLAQAEAHEQMSMGATHMQVRRLGDWWLTAVGEVPGQTLTAFLQGLERPQ